MENKLYEILGRHIAEKYTMNDLNFDELDVIEIISTFEEALESHPGHKNLTDDFWMMR